MLQARIPHLIFTNPTSFMIHHRPYWNPISVLFHHGTMKTTPPTNDDRPVVASQKATSKSITLQHNDPGKVSTALPWRRALNLSN